MMHSQDPGDTEIGSSGDFKLNVNLVWKDVENVENKDRKGHFRRGRGI